MKKTMISISVILIIFTALFIFTGLESNSNTLKISKVNHPVKVRLSGISEGESFTYFIDGGLSQTVNKSSFLLNLSSGNHSICVQSSGNKYGRLNFIRDASPYIQDVYVNMQNQTAGSSPCQND